MRKETSLGVARVLAVVIGVAALPLSLLGATGVVGAVNGETSISRAVVSFTMGLGGVLVATLLCLPTTRRQRPVSMYAFFALAVVLAVAIVATYPFALGMLH